MKRKLDVSKITGPIPSDIGDMETLEKIWICEYVEYISVNDECKL